MSPDSIIRISTAKALKDLYGLDVEPETIIPSATKKEFEGDMTLVVFPWVKAARKAPDAVAKEIGDYLVDNEPAVSRYNVIKGFLNLVIDPLFWNSVLRGIARQENYGFTEATE
ncbi:MAG: arginine--tRNA ligase, partial [Candidatus Amulumruptor sp.]